MKYVWPFLAVLDQYSHTLMSVRHLILWEHLFIFINFPKVFWPIQLSHQCIIKSLAVSVRLKILVSIRYVFWRLSNVRCYPLQCQCHHKRDTRKVRYCSETIHEQFCLLIMKDYKLVFVFLMKTQTVNFFKLNSGMKNRLTFWTSNMLQATIVSFHGNPWCHSLTPHIFELTEQSLFSHLVSHSHEYKPAHWS